MNGAIQRKNTTKFPLIDYADLYIDFDKYFHLNLIQKNLVSDRKEDLNLNFTESKE